MIEQSKRRVLIFRNGKGTEGVEIVADPERFEDVCYMLIHQFSIIIVHCSICHEIPDKTSKHSNFDQL